MGVFIQSPLPQRILNDFTIAKAAPDFTGTAFAISFVKLIVII